MYSLKKIALSPQRVLIGLLVAILFTNCNKNPPVVEPCPKCPVITKLSPDHGRTGDEITIEGKNFGGYLESEDEITFNGKKVTLLAAAPTHNFLKVRVPERCGDGPVIIKIGSLRSDELAESPTFTYDYVAVDDIQPNQGKPGDKVLIFGEHFSDDPLDNEVIFSGNNPLDTIFAQVTQARNDVLEIIVPEDGITGGIKVRVDGHIANAPSFSYQGDVVIDSLSPDHGRKDEVITIHGKNFRLDPQAHEVTFAGNVQGVIINGTDNTLEVKIPEGAQTGKIVLEVDDKTINGPVFTYDLAQIHSLIPNHGRKGDLITIQGKFFSPIPSENEVSFDGVIATVNSASENELIVEVPDGAATGKVFVTVDNHIAEGPIFTYDKVIATALVPNHGRKNEILQIKGKFFSSVLSENKISFNGVSADAQSVLGDSVIFVAVPEGADNGLVTVSVDNQTTIGLNFTYDRPSISSISPDKGKMNTIVTVNGQFFGLDINEVNVTFNDVPADIESIHSENQLTVKVPQGAMTGDVKIEIDGYSAIGPAFEYQFTVNVSTVAGNGTAGSNNGTGTGARFNRPSGITFDASGNMYVADLYNHRIRQITPAGVVSTYAGGSEGFTNGFKSIASFKRPNDVYIDNNGDMLITDGGNNVIRKINTTTGFVSTFYGTGSTSFLQQPNSTIQDASGNVYVGDGVNHRLIKIPSTGSPQVFAGNSGNSGYLDGTGTTAQFFIPGGLSFDNNGDIIVADVLNHRIRRVTPGRVVTTVAGNGNFGYSDGPAAFAEFNGPVATAVDEYGNIFVAEEQNHTIRMISPSGEVTTFLGTTTPGFAGGDETTTRLNKPIALRFDSQGNLYIAEGGNHAIRKVTIQ